VPWFAVYLVTKRVVTFSVNVTIQEWKIAGELDVLMNKDAPKILQSLGPGERRRHTLNGTGGRAHDMTVKYSIFKSSTNMLA
jgi:hypothetical protein